MEVIRREWENCDSVLELYVDMGQMERLDRMCNEIYSRNI